MARITRAALLAHMERLGACSEAVAWVRDTPGTPAALWESCPRGDWMLWLAALSAVDRKLVVLAACDCARTALRHVPAGEDRPRVAIETAEAWCRGETTIEQVRAAYAAAYADGYAAAAAAAAAYAAAYADAAAAAYAAAAAADADAYAAAADARRRSLARSAIFVRKRIPWAVVARALGGEM